MLWKNTEECAVSENRCLKNFVNFEEKHLVKLLFKTKLQVTWHLLGMFFWKIYEIFRTAFTRNSCECRLLQLVVAGKCFHQNIFFKKYLIRFDIQWHMLPGINCIRDVQELNIWITRIVRLFLIYSKYISIYQGF